MEESQKSCDNVEMYAGRQDSYKQYKIDFNISFPILFDLFSHLKLWLKMLIKISIYYKLNYDKQKIQFKRGTKDTKGDSQLVQDYNCWQWLNIAKKDNCNHSILNVLLTSSLLDNLHFMLSIMSKTIIKLIWICFWSLSNQTFKLLDFFDQR